MRSFHGQSVQFLTDADRRDRERMRQVYSRSQGEGGSHHRPEPLAETPEREMDRRHYQERRDMQDRHHREGQRLRDDQATRRSRDILVSRNVAHDDEGEFRRLVRKHEQERDEMERRHDRERAQLKPHRRAS